MAFQLAIEREAISVEKDGIYISISVVDQATFDKRIGGLLQFAAAGFKTIISYEPALGPLSFDEFFFHTSCDKLNDPDCPKYPFDQVIAGCETGGGARPCNPDWIRFIANQCRAAGVPFFLKKLNRNTRLLDGRRHDELDWRRSDG